MHEPQYLSFDTLKVPCSIHICTYFRRDMTLPKLNGLLLLKLIQIKGEFVPLPVLLRILIVSMIFRSIAEGDITFFMIIDLRAISNRVGRRNSRNLEAGSQSRCLRHQCSLRTRGGTSKSSQNHRSCQKYDLNRFYSK